MNDLYFYYFIIGKFSIKYLINNFGKFLWKYKLKNIRKEKNFPKSSQKALLSSFITIVEVFTFD